MRNSFRVRPGKFGDCLDFEAARFIRIVDTELVLAYNQLRQCLTFIESALLHGPGYIPS